MRRLALLEARRRAGSGPRREPVTRIDFRIVDFPGWEKAGELGCEPGGDHLRLRKSP
jgi:hypothetical protein